MAPFRRVAMDLDGTLLSPSHELLPETRKTLQELSSSHAVTVCLATGRSPSSLIRYVNELNLKVPLPVVCLNGTCAYIFQPPTPPQQHLYGRSLKRQPSLILSLNLQSLQPTILQPSTRPIPTTRVDLQRTRACKFIIREA
jgi:hydroxymethylpyrimidine pyrophosphatase-like HAD family hydrolase